MSRSDFKCVQPWVQPKLTHELLAEITICIRSLTEIRRSDVAEEVRRIRFMETEQHRLVPLLRSLFTIEGEHLAEALIDYCWHHNMIVPESLKDFFARDCKHLVCRLLLESDIKELEPFINPQHYFYEILKMDYHNFGKNILKIKARIAQIRRSQKLVFIQGMGTKAKKDERKANVSDVKADAVPSLPKFYGNVLYDRNVVPLIFEFMHVVSTDHAVTLNDARIAADSAEMATLATVMAGLANKTTAVIANPSPNDLLAEEFAAFTTHLDALFEGRYEDYEGFDFLDTYTLHSNHEQLQKYLKAKNHAAGDIVQLPLNINNVQAIKRAARANNFLGFCHFYFYNNYQTASLYFDTACKLGCADAWFHRAWMDISGHAHHEKGAVYCLEKAGCMGHGVAARYAALHYLGEYLIRDTVEFNPRKALDILEKSIANGGKWGLCLAGDLYYAGYNTATPMQCPDNWRALECYKRAFECGVLTARAMTNIATMYRDGQLMGKPDHFTAIICEDAARSIRTGESVIDSQAVFLFANSLIAEFYDKYANEMTQPSIDRLSEYKELINEKFEKLIKLGQIDQFRIAFEEEREVCDKIHRQSGRLGLQKLKLIEARIQHLRKKNVTNAFVNIDAKANTRDAKDELPENKAFAAAALRGDTVFAAANVGAAAGAGAGARGSAAVFGDAKEYVAPAPLKASKNLLNYPVIALALRLITETLDYHEQDSACRSSCVIL